MTLRTKLLDAIIIYGCSGLSPWQGNWPAPLVSANSSESLKLADLSIALHQRVRVILMVPEKFLLLTLGVLNKLPLVS